MMTVLDGRNSNRVPEIIQISDYKVFETRLITNENVQCLIINDCYVPCVKNDGMYSDKYEYILCAAYKTYHGFANWYKRQYI